MIRNALSRLANNSTNNTTGGAAGPMRKPGGAPQLPDVVPDGVQALLDGIFGFTGEMGKAFGNLVSGLADAIQGPEAAGQIVPLAIDVAGVVV